MSTKLQQSNEKLESVRKLTAAFYAMVADVLVDSVLVGMEASLELGAQLTCNVL